MIVDAWMQHPTARFLRQDMMLPWLWEVPPTDRRLYPLRVAGAVEAARGSPSLE